MKAIASVAIAQKFTIGQNMAADLCTAAIISALSVLGLITLLGKHLPVPVVKGIQMGVGLSLISFSQVLTTALQWSPARYPADNWVLAICIFLFFFLATSRRIPQAAMIFFLGIIFASINVDSSLPKLGTDLQPFSVPSLSDFKVGFFDAAIGQVPLTTLNSIIAVVAVSEDLLPHREPPNITHLGVSIGIMNLIGCCFGSMPVCHGSGGLLSQHRYVFQVKQLDLL